MLLSSNFLLSYPLLRFVKIQQIQKFSVEVFLPMHMEGIPFTLFHSQLISTKKGKSSSGLKPWRPFIYLNVSIRNKNIHSGKDYALWN